MKVVSRPLSPVEWKTFLTTRDEALRARLIENYFPLVKRVSGKMFRKVPSVVDFDDMTSLGVMGLIRAVDNFNPDKGNFESFCVLSIRSTILDGLRANDWAPRSLRKRSKEIQKASQELEKQLGRDPVSIEIAVKLEISEKEVLATQQDLEKLIWGSLDEPGSGGANLKNDENVDRHEAITDEQTPEFLTGKFLELMVDDLLQDLSLQQRLLLALCYFKKNTLRQAGEVLGLTEAKASQIHSKTILNIRSKLVEALGDSA